MSVTYRCSRCLWRARANTIFIPFSSHFQHFFFHFLSVLWPFPFVSSAHYRLADRQYCNDIFLFNSSPLPFTWKKNGVQPLLRREPLTPPLFSLAGGRLSQSFYDNKMTPHFERFFRSIATIRIESHQEILNTFHEYNRTSPKHVSRDFTISWLGLVVKGYWF